MRTALIFIATLLLTACANSPSKPPRQDVGTPIYLQVVPSPDIASSRDWLDFVQEWRGAMQQSAKENGYSFAGVNQDPPAEATPGYLVRVNISDYRFISTTARILFGIMTGNAYIQGGSTISTVPAKQPVSSTSIDVSSTAWGGVSSAMTGRQLSNIADGILSQIKAYDSRPKRAAANTTGGPPPTPAPDDSRYRQGNCRWLSATQYSCN